MKMKSFILKFSSEYSIIPPENFKISNVEDIAELQQNNLESFLKNNGIKLDTKYLDFYNNSLKDGAGVILASIEKECIAVFALEDSIKNGAKELIADLKAKNILNPEKLNC